MFYAFFVFFFLSFGFLLYVCVFLLFHHLHVAFHVFFFTFCFVSFKRHFYSSSIHVLSCFAWLNALKLLFHFDIFVFFSHNIIFAISFYNCGHRFVPIRSYNVTAGMKLISPKFVWKFSPQFSYTVKKAKGERNGGRVLRLRLMLPEIMVFSSSCAIYQNKWWTRKNEKHEGGVCVWGGEGGDSKWKEEDDEGFILRIFFCMINTVRNCMHVYMCVFRLPLAIVQPSWVFFVLFLYVHD